MADTDRSADARLSDAGIAPALDWQASMFANLMLVPQAYLDAMTTWQRTWNAVNQALWDEWRCRYGMPIDG